MKEGDVGMAKCFSMQSKSYSRFPALKALVNVVEGSLFAAGV